MARQEYFTVVKSFHITEGMAKSVKEQSKKRNMREAEYIREAIRIHIKRTTKESKEIES